MKTPALLVAAAVLCLAAGCNPAADAKNGTVHEFY